MWLESISHLDQCDFCLVLASLTSGFLIAVCSKMTGEVVMELSCTSVEGLRSMMLELLGKLELF